MSKPERKQKIDPAHPLTVSRQCQLLSISRSSAYYKPQPLSEAELRLMRQLDALHLKYPFYGSRRLIDAMLSDYGVMINRKRVRRLMRLMGVNALYPGSKGSSRPNKAHKVYPYLLRDLRIDHANQVWATDITYIPMRRGFAYLVAVMDWQSRKVLSWQLSNVMDADFCIEALQEALNRYGAPEIFNSDQGSQFTSEAFTGDLKQHGIKISMDGKGRWMDNVFVERLWRSVKYEEVYLHAYEDLNEARTGLQKYFNFYNTKRRHQSLGCTPETMYYDNLPALKQAG